MNFLTVQVVAIVTAGSSSGKGLFFPNGLNGVINGQPMKAGRKLQSVPDVVLPTRSLKAADSQVTDVNILNFALNLEYLEAEFYSWAVNGHGIPTMYRGKGGRASTGGQKAKLSGTVLVRKLTSDPINILKRIMCRMKPLPLLHWYVICEFSHADSLTLSGSRQGHRHR